MYASDVSFIETLDGEVYVVLHHNYYPETKRYLYNIVINTNNHNLDDLLCFASRQGNIYVMKKLIECGALRNNYYAIGEAVINGHKDAVNLLEEHWRWC